MVGIVLLNLHAFDVLPRGLRRLTSVLHENFQEQVADLTNIFFLVVNLANDPRVGSSKLGELLIRGDICEFLELFNFVTFLDVELLDCALFDFLAEIGEVELDDAEVVAGEEAEATNSSPGSPGEPVQREHQLCKVDMISTRSTSARLEIITTDEPGRPLLPVGTRHHPPAQ